MKKNIYYIFLFASVWCNAQKTTTFFNSQSYGQADGLEVDDAINYISCDNKNFIWICTGNGLYRFSGTLFKKFPAKKNVAYTLPSNNVRFFIQDKKGKYFLGCVGSAVSIYNDSTGYFYPFTLINDTLNLNKYILGAPYIDKENNLWLGIETKGIICINTTNHTYKFYSTENKTTHNHGFVSTTWINTISQSKNGEIFAGTNFGAIALNPELGNFKNYFHAYKNLNHSNGDVFEDDDGSLWMATWAQGLLHFFPDKNIWEQYFIRPQTTNGTQNILQSILPKNKNELWIGSYYGVQIFNKIEKKFYPVTDLQNQVMQAGAIENPLLSKFIKGWFITTDKDGNLWTFMEKTLSRINLSNNLFLYHFVSFGKVDNSAAFSFTKIFINPKNKNQYLFCSGYGKGIYLFDKNTEQSTTPTGTNTPGISYFVNDAKLINNQVWLCTDKGLFIYDFLKQQFVSLPSKDLQTITFNKEINSIAFTDSLIWISGSNLIKFNKIVNKCSIINGGNNALFPSQLINKLFTDKKNNLWLAFGEGKNVCCLQNNSNKLFDYNLKQEINLGNGISITETPDGTVFYSGRENGLYKIEHPLQSTEKVSLFTTGNGLPSDRIHSIFCDSAGYLWLQTSNGLSICNTTSMQFFNYNVNNNFPQNDIYSTPSEIEKGKIIFPLQYGYTIIDRDSLLLKIEKEIPIVIQRFAINGRASKVNVDYGGSLDLPYNQNNFSIDFSALCFQDVNGIDYCYHIKGLNTDTVNIFNHTNITLYSLPFGDYTLQIFAKQRNKPIQKNAYQLSFKIRPPFWKTWWFISLCILAFGSLLYMLYRYRINQITRLYKLRNSIAQDLHDDVGSTMTTISILSDVAKKQIQKNDSPTLLMDEIGNNARGLMEKLDDIVWSVNPKNDSFNEMTLRMKKQAIDLLSNKGIKVNFSMPSNIDTVTLSMQERRNIFLVFKEAIHNISKYAEAKNVDIIINILKHELKMKIKDDGKGFEITNVEKGNGLNNMKERAKLCGGNCTINSIKENGTEINFIIPI